MNDAELAQYRQDKLDPPEREVMHARRVELGGPRCRGTVDPLARHTSSYNPTDDTEVPYDEEEYDR